MIGVTRHGLSWEQVKEDSILSLSRASSELQLAARICDYEEEF